MSRVLRHDLTHLAADLTYLGRLGVAVSLCLFTLSGCKSNAKPEFTQMMSTKRPLSNHEIVKAQTQISLIKNYYKNDNSSASSKLKQSNFLSSSTSTHLTLVEKKWQAHHIVVSRLDIHMGFNQRLPLPEFSPRPQAANVVPITQLVNIGSPYFMDYEIIPHIIG